MTADRTVRLSEIGAVLAERMPAVLDAAITLLESVAPAAGTPRSARYEIERKIGEGGQAEVLLGTFRSAEGFQRLVAVKRVRSDLADAASPTARLLEEAHLVSRLSHPNVVSVLDLDRDRAGQPFLVMEYVDGISLEKLIDTGPVPRPVGIFIVRELLSALGYIHRFRGRGGVRGLVHRDVSPHNVLLSWQGEVKLADFGVAQILESTMPAGAYAPVGKAGYMSPEQVNRQELDGRSDLYSVGIVLWELLVHRRLRVGAPGDLKAHFVFQDIPRPSEYRPGVPADLDAVTMRLLAFNRDDRHATAALAARDLMRCRDVPRDGREDLARFLGDRFPIARRQRPRSHPPEPGTSSERVRTMTAPSGAPIDAPQWPRDGDDQCCGGTPEQARWWWALVFSVLLLVLAAVIALSMVR